MPPLRLVRLKYAISSPFGSMTCRSRSFRSDQKRVTLTSPVPTHWQLAQVALRPHSASVSHCSPGSRRPLPQPTSLGQRSGGDAFLAMNFPGWSFTTVPPKSEQNWTVPSVSTIPTLPCFGSSSVIPVVFPTTLRPDFCFTRASVMGDPLNLATVREWLRRHPD